MAIPDDINPQSPAFTSAQRACAKLAQGGSGQGSSSESPKLQLLSLAKCIRKHGVPSFPDPTSSPPPPGNGNVIGGNGTYLAVGPPDQPAITRVQTRGSRLRDPGTTMTVLMRDSHAGEDRL